MTLRNLAAVTPNYLDARIGIFVDADGFGLFEAPDDVTADL